MGKTRRLARRVVLIGVLGCLGCAVAPPAAPRETLESRVEEYWRLRQRRDLLGMYDYYSAGYRGRQPRNEFVKKARLVRFEILEFRIVRTVVSGDRAEVTVGYRTVVPTIPQPVSGEVTDTWVRDPDGRWYKEREILVSPFPVQGGEPRVVED